MRPPAFTVIGLLAGLLILTSCATPGPSQAPHASPSSPPGPSASPRPGSPTASASPSRETSEGSSIRLRAANGDLILRVKTRRPRFLYRLYDAQGMDVNTLVISDGTVRAVDTTEGDPILQVRRRDGRVVVEDPSGNIRYRIVEKDSGKTSVQVQDADGRKVGTGHREADGWRWTGPGRAPGPLVVGQGRNLEVKSAQGKPAGSIEADEGESTAQAFWLLAPGLDVTTRSALMLFYTLGP